MSIEEQIKGWSEQATTLGREAGIAAASWTLDGNHPTEHYERLARMMDDGDPALDDCLPARPNLSGEWADAMTPRGLFETVTGLDAHAEASWNYDAYQSVLDALCEAWEAAAGEAFDHEAERLVKGTLS